jgi:hypothetical protein
MPNAKLHEALACAKRGWAVFPLHNIRGGRCTCNKSQCDSKGKHPRSDWNIITRGVLEASTDESAIINWWGKWPDANIGIATGAKSGIVAVDIDPRHGGDESWRNLESEHGRVETVQSLTGGGGCHYLFSCPEGTRIANGASIGGNQGVDIRGDGGYIVGPTSDHISGKNYEWEMLSGPDDIPLAPMPEWLIKICCNGNGLKTAVEPGQPIPQGARDQTLIKMAGAMRRQGMTADEMIIALAAVNQSRCQPPLADADIQRIAKSAGRYTPEPDVMDGIDFYSLSTEKTEQLDVGTEKTENTPKTLNILKTTEQKLNNSGRPISNGESLTKLTNGQNTDKSDKQAETLTRLTKTDKTDNEVKKASVNPPLNNPPYPSPQAELYHENKVISIDDANQSLDEYQETRGRAIWKIVNGWMADHRGEKFDLDTICRQLDVKTRHDRQHVAKKLAYEVNKGELEKSDRIYRAIDREYTSIDWLNASEAPPLAIRWPYGIRDNTSFGFDGHVVISPGDIVVIAGVSNMGKSAMCLNLLWNNMDTYPCTLMGNEYEAGKFKRRVAHMNWANPVDGQGEPKFELIERYDNWADIIRPDNINIIDWINLGDAFYQIGAIIQGIKAKLRNGIAVIVLQKTETKSLGLGGGFSEHLASLYLLIDQGRLTVRKAKEWYEVNPNGKMYGFQIEDAGSKFANIREVIKCRSCNGAGRTNRGECQECESRGYVELPKVKEKQTSWPQKY